MKAEERALFEQASHQRAAALEALLCFEKHLQEQLQREAEAAVCFSDAVYLAGGVTRLWGAEVEVSGYGELLGAVQRSAMFKVPFTWVAGNYRAR